MAEQRNLVIGLDGTWNDTDSEEEITNVVRLLRALFRRGHVQHYEEGVGTAHWEALPGGVYGEGLDRQILGGYRFLRKRFADADYAHEDNKVFRLQSRCLCRTAPGRHGGFLWSAKQGG